MQVLSRSRAKLRPRDSRIMTIHIETWTTVCINDLIGLAFGVAARHCTALHCIALLGSLWQVDLDGWMDTEAFPFLGCQVSSEASQQLSAYIHPSIHTCVYPQDFIHLATWSRSSRISQEAHVCICNIRFTSSLKKKKHKISLLIEFGAFCLARSLARSLFEGDNELSL